MLERIQLNNMQLMRIKSHPVKVKTEEKFIIVDDLENGELRLYEQIGASLNALQLLTGYGEPDNAVLVAKIIINELWKEKGIFIHRIFCEYGYKYLAEPMVYQVLDFAEFYNDYQAVGISDREYETWFPYAKEVLGDFQKSNRIYVYDKK
ncbi:hypothetical protein VSQ32_00165 [Lachnospiraceae bacterium KK002]